MMQNTDQISNIKQEAYTEKWHKHSVTLNYATSFFLVKI